MYHVPCGLGILTFNIKNSATNTKVMMLRAADLNINIIGSMSEIYVTGSPL
jgi:hypothetical protein